MKVVEPGAGRAQPSRFQVNAVVPTPLRRPAAATALVGVMLLAACSPAPTAEPVDADTPWDDVVAGAESEGAVALYTAQLPENLATFEEAFEAEYDIDLTVVRANGPDNTARIEQERASGRVGADVWVETDLSGLEAKVEEGGWFAPVVGPAFAEQPVSELVVGEGMMATVGAVAVVAGWNTDEFPDGLDDYTDLLDPRLAGGKIGLVEPVAPAQVDLYIWMEETFGEGFLEQLAAQRPRIYPSTVPMGQALASGEIAASPGVLPQEEAQATGAPVDSVVSPAGVWATRCFAMVMREAPHPNAAQVLMEFMVSESGQATINHQHPAVLDGVEGTLSGMDDVRPADAVAGLDASRVESFKAEWDRLFM